MVGCLWEGDDGVVEWFGKVLLRKLCGCYKRNAREKTIMFGTVPRGSEW